MPHYKKDSRKPTTTISIDADLLEQVEDYRFKYRFENRSAAMADLIEKGYKYYQLLEKKKNSKK